MSILSSYLWREFVASFGAVVLILLAVIFSFTLADVLSEVARNRVPIDLLFSQLLLRAIEASVLLTPLAAFLAVLLPLGRMYRDSEMAALASSGFSPLAQLRVVLGFALPMAVLTALLALIAAPWASNVSRLTMENAQRAVAIMGLTAGRFIELPNSRTVVFVERLDEAQSEFERAFVFTDRGDRLDVLAAQRGMQRIEPGGERFLILEQGSRSEGDPRLSDFRLMRFARNEIKLPPPEARRTDPYRALPLEALLADGSSGALGELAFRINAPLTAFVLTLLAVPLARSQPRQTRHARLLLALGIYLTYANLGLLMRGWVQAGQLSPVYGVAALHGFFALLAVALLYLDMRERRVPLLAT